MGKQIIKEFLNSWKQGVIEIGKAYQEGADFKTLAEVFIENHYAFSEENIYLSLPLLQSKFSGILKLMPYLILLRVILQKIKGLHLNLGRLLRSMNLTFF